MADSCIALVEIFSVGMLFNVRIYSVMGKSFLNHYFLTSVRGHLGRSCCWLCWHSVKNKRSRNVTEKPSWHTPDVYWQRACVPPAGSIVVMLIPPDTMATPIKYW